MTEREFEKIIDRYTAYVVAVISKVAKERLNQEDIEELASDVFAKLWERKNELNIQEGKEKAYIGASARNHTLNLLKKRGLLSTIPLEEDVISDNATPEKVLLEEEEATTIRKVIESLPEPDDEIFIRRYFYFEKIIDIARALNMKEQTVTTKLHRGKQKLAKLFKERGIEG
ncbi:MAG: RNA polymerase sigma factor [Zhenhengia sp.]|uniref:RNA polymerase sigma factor n=1 Tax=Zhenhengia sp. TaxID=2944208 RepID=UPI002907B03B|nr:sigma-70 family RNA polymerase sigma factor [Clostridiales bacterium]MDU6974759.1 sigma-70 family RNA polymerase sigma factor [Clostridiales bacterium]